MNVVIQQQVCRLCHEPRKLCNSHFLPAVFYRHLGLDEAGTFQNKALPRLTRDKLMHVPKHVTRYLLCDDCEQRFSRGGESWVSRVGYQVGRGFKLQDILKQTEPHLTLDTGWVYSANDDEAIDWGKLAYFALSVFWRGAADSWKDNRGGKPFLVMDAALQESLRLFLLGQAGYPQDVMLMVRIASSRKGPAHLMSFPSKGDITVPNWRAPQYTFIIPGMILTLIPGPGIPEQFIRQGCLIRGEGHPMFVMKSDDLFVREQLMLLRTAEPSQKIIDEVLAALSVRKKR